MANGVDVTNRMAPSSSASASSASTTRSGRLELDDVRKERCVREAREVPSRRVARRRGDEDDDEIIPSGECVDEPSSTTWTPGVMFRLDVLVVLFDWFLTMLWCALRARVRGRRVGVDEDARQPPKWLRADDSNDDDIYAVGALVTGWSSGLGRASAIALARRGFAIVVPYRLGGMDAARGLEAACKSARADARVEFVGPLDVSCASDLHGMRLDGVRARGVDVRVVVHCAGVFNTNRWAMRSDGGDPTAAVNFHGVAALTKTVLDDVAPVGKREAPTNHIRVVFVGSFTHECATARLLSLNAFKRWLKNYGATPRYYNPALNYMWSKVAVSAYATYAHDAWRVTYGDRVSAVLVDPGLVDTRLIRGWPTALQRIFCFVGKASGLMQSPAAAASGVVRAVCHAPGDETCPFIYGPTGTHVRESYWMRHGKAAAGSWAKLSFY